MKTLLIVLLFFGAVCGLDVKDIVIIILSQPDEHHLQMAEHLRTNIKLQAETLQGEKPVVHLSHVDFPHVGHWTVVPLLPQVFDLHGNNCSWIVFVEDRTQIILEKLREVLGKRDHKKPMWLGHALHDNEATIIHHFAFYDNPKKFKYPNLASGIAISTVLLRRLTDRLKLQNEPQSDFGIDNSHELALFIWDKGNGELLTDEKAFCVEESEGCAAFVTPFQKCDGLVQKEEIFFAVKTCQKFHNDRVPVVLETWGKHAPQITFFSDVEDKSIPTVSLGVPNTEQGHCAKTLAILKHTKKKILGQSKIKWIVVADDDTILGLQDLLACYNSSKPIALGQRYGYNVFSTRGYNYITGGGGMVFSRSLLELLTEEGVCECPSLNAPDDMFLGVCIANLGVEITHSPFFHQARPKDYPPQYLQTRDAVSFHKHWMVDPIKIYNSWFAEDDRVSKHDEL